MADEDLDLAIALSLEHADEVRTAGGVDSQEHAFFTSLPLLPPHTHRDRDRQREQKTDRGGDRGGYTEDDAALARVLQEEEDACARHAAPDTAPSSHPSSDPHTAPNTASSSHPYSRTERRSRPSQTKKDKKMSWNPLAVLFGGNKPTQTNENSCFECGGRIIGRYLRIGDKLYHGQCFRCAGCHNPISSSHIRPDQNSEQYYHVECHSELFGVKCDLCGDSLVNKQYLTHGFFHGDQKYCVTHMGATQNCFSCNMIQPLASYGEPFPTLPDGRLVCWQCTNLLVLDSSEARPLYDEVLGFMERDLGLPIPKQMKEVPVLSVDLPSLNEQYKLNQRSCPGAHPTPQHGKLSSNDGGYSSALTRGLTLTTISQVRYVQPGNWGWMSRPSQGSFDTMSLSRTCSVTAVLVLCGLPRDLTASILAHEAMHVWFKLREESPGGRGAPVLDLPLQVEEGMCQLVAHKYLDSLQLNSTAGIASDDPHTWEQKLRRYFKYQIETDPSPVYGDGFRKASKCAAAIGLFNLIDYLVSAHTFPDI